MTGRVLWTGHRGLPDGPKLAEKIKELLSSDVVAIEEYHEVSFEWLREAMAIL